MNVSLRHVSQYVVFYRSAQLNIQYTQYIPILFILTHLNLISHKTLMLEGKMGVNLLKLGHKALFSIPKM